ncbi:NACHT domain-containing NTPase [Micromonospora sp. ATCC 39149]|uniref:NACHT domain-containing protein n=1 Tax=Micromonospora carbonacea TaxID=47853 RepID=A0A7D6GFV0_9ACTN|nr:hypothetical protein [Micromonospora sp. ATCC 39149]QLK00645.1 hypothetical protein HZU44_11940 [Micromonospora carbonacea]
MGWVRSRVTVAVLLVLSYSAVLLLVYLRQGPFADQSSAPLEVASWASAVAAVLLSILQIFLSLPRRQSAGERASTPEQVTHARAMMARDSRFLVQREIRRRELGGSVPLQVRWSAGGRGRGEDGRKGVAVAGSTAGLSGTVDDIAVRLGEAGVSRLVLLGNGGSGKTSLALLVADRLLVTGSGPVPVVLSLSSWDPTDEDLLEWILRRICTDFAGFANVAAYGSTAASQLLLDGELLPVLDGLDEVPSAVRPKAYRQLRDLPERIPLLLTCRSKEFGDLKLHAGTPILEIQPLAPAAALDYLAGQDERWRPLSRRIEDGEDIGALAGVLSTPLMVFLALRVFRSGDRDPAELLDRKRFRTKGSIEDHLLDEFVPAVIGQHDDFVDGTSRIEAQLAGHSERRARWSKTKAQTYARVLARHLRLTGERDLEWWTLRKSFPTPGGTFPVVAILAVITAATLVRLLRGESVLPTGLEIALGGVAGAIASQIHRWADLHSGIRMQPALNLGAGLAALGGPLIGLLVGRWAGDPSLGVMSGAAAATVITVGTSRLAARTGGSERVLTARRLLRRVRNAAIAGALIWGSGFGLLTWLTTHAAVMAACIAAGAAVIQLRVSPWAFYVDARLSAARQQLLPLRLLRLLDDLARLGVLQEAGASYQFRHEALATRLAVDPIPRPAKSSG